MLVLIEKLIKFLAALITYIAAKLTEKYPLWLFIVVFLACVLFFSVVSCEHEKSVSRALVGKTEYQGHSFLIFKQVNDNKTLAVVHDPDCPCYFVEPINVED